MAFLGNKQKSRRSPNRQRRDTTLQDGFRHAATKTERLNEKARQRQLSDQQSGLRSLIVYWLQRVGLIVLLLALTASLVNVLSISKHVQVMPLTSSSNTALLGSQAEYQAVVDKLLNSSIWNRNKITIDTKSISRQLSVQFPELQSVSITLPLIGHQPIVYIEPSQPALLLTAQNGTFVIDNNGKAILKQNSQTQIDVKKLPALLDQSGLTVRQNRQALTSTDVQFILTVIAELNARQFAVDGLTFPPSARQLDVHIQGKPYLVKFNLQSDSARKQSGTFLATIAQLEKQNITPAQYVDVRVEGRAYYQ